MEFFTKAAIALGLMKQPHPVPPKKVQIVVDENKSTERKHKPRPSTPLPIKTGFGQIKVEDIVGNASDDDDTPIIHHKRGLKRTQSFISSMSITRMSPDESSSHVSPPSDEEGDE